MALLNICLIVYSYDKKYYSIFNSINKYKVQQGMKPISIQKLPQLCCIRRDFIKINMYEAVAKLLSNKV